MLGRILQIVSGNYYVYLTDSKQTVIAKPLGIFRHEKKKIKPIVGDNVEIILKDNYYLISNVYNRKCEIKRPQVANIDLLVLVVSWLEPEFNHLVLNKYLAYYEYYCPQVAIIFTKSDLVSNINQIQLNYKTVESYKNDGYLVFDSNNIFDIETLKNKFSNHTICFIGNSGVGKSTLINKLNPEFNLKTQMISKALNRGKHTTTASILLPFLNGFLIDTPGFATLDLDLTINQLARAYHDYYQWSPKCQFDDCLHTLNTKNCYVLNNVQQGKSSIQRYQDYLQIMDETKKNSNYR